MTEKRHPTDELLSTLNKVFTKWHGAGGPSLNKDWAKRLDIKEDDDALNKLSEKIWKIDCDLKEIQTQVNDILRKRAYDAGKKRLNRLPNEILADILSLASSAVYHHFFSNARNEYRLRDLCLTCRRFNDIISKDPRFWNCISTDKNVRTIKRDLKLAGNAPLEVQLFSRHSRLHKNRLDAVLERKQQWRSLRIAVQYSTDAIKKFPPLSFDAVSHLELDFFADSGTVYNLWSFRNLRSLKISYGSSGFSATLPPPSSFPLLQKLMVSNMTYHLRDFIAFIRTSPSINILDIDHCRPTREPDPSREPADLLALEVLRIVCASPDELTSFRRLNYPGLKSVNIILKKRGCITSETWWQSILHTGSYPQLQQVALMAPSWGSDPDKRNSFYLGVLVSRYRSIRSLTLNLNLPQLLRIGVEEIYNTMCGAKKSNGLQQLTIPQGTSLASYVLRSLKDHDVALHFTKPFEG